MKEKSDKLDIADIIDAVNKKDNTVNPNNNNDIESMKQLEIAKIIVEKTLNDENLKSLTFLNNEQVDDIVKARLLNVYYNIPEIDQYIKDYLELKRSSNDGTLIRLFTKMAMFNNESDEVGQKGFFNRILKR